MLRRFLFNTSETSVHGRFNWRGTDHSEVLRRNLFNTSETSVHGWFNWRWTDCSGVLRRNLFNTSETSVRCRSTWPFQDILELLRILPENKHHHGYQPIKSLLKYRHRTDGSEVLSRYLSNTSEVCLLSLFFIIYK